MPTIKQAHWPEDEATLRMLRHTVFVEEQNVPEELEWEGDDDDAYHWVLYEDDGSPVGTSRLLPSGAIGRMAILKQARGKQYGKLLLEAAINYAENELHFHEVFLSAQTHARDFYRKSGFIEEGEIYDEAGIPHIKMRKKLISNHLLGEHAGKFFVSDHAEAVLSLTSQCQRQLRILNYNLDHSVFDSQAMIDAISALARKHRYSEIKIIVIDSNALVKRGHKLLKLQQKLSSHISIKLLQDDTGAKENVVIADNCGLVVQPMKNPEAIWGDFNNVPVAQTYIEQFDLLWAQANESTEFRILDL